MHLICAVKIGLRRCVKSNGGQDFTVMDAEAGNRVNIVDMVCPSCEAELNRIKRTIKTLYVLVKVLGIVVLVMLIAMAMLAFRVMQIEQCNTSLQDKKDNIKDKLKLEEAVFQSLQTVDDKEPERISNEIFNAQQLRIFLRTKRASEKRQKRERKKKRCKKDSAANRNSRHVSSSVPHFYLNGSGQTTSDGKFKWSFPTGRNFDSMDQFSAQLDSSTNDLTEVKIRSTGVYFVYAKVTINGRSRRDSLVKPAVGIFLRRRRNYGNQDVDEELDSSWLTQDERGIRTYTQSGYSGDIIDTQYPVDTLSVQGLFRLEANDRIYIQKPKDALYDPAGERYVNGLKYSRFAAYLVESGQSYG